MTTNRDEILPTPVGFVSLDEEQIAHPSVRRLEPKDGFERYEIRHRLDEQAQKYFGKDGVRLEWRQRSAKHMHGSANVSRGLAELAMWELITSHHTDERLRVDDIGSNVSRTVAMVASVGAKGRVQLHHMMPDVLSGDARRRLAARGRSWCPHKAQDCNCANSPDVAVSTHSLYYLNPDEVGEFLLRRYSKHMMYAIVHRCDEMAGSLVNGDLKYRLHLDGQVHAEAANDNHGYVHAPNDWMFRSHIATSSGCIFSEVLYHRFDTYVLRLTLADVDVEYQEVRNPTFEDVLEPNAYGQNVRFTASAVSELRTLMRLDAVAVPSVELHAYANYLGVRTGTRNVAFVPKRLIAKLASEIVYSERTLSCLRTMVASAQRYCNNSGIPDEVVENIKLYAPVLAWVRNMAAETALLGRAVVTTRRLRLAHEEALNLRGVEKEHSCWFLNPFNWCNRDFETEEGQRFMNVSESRFFDYCIKTRIPCVLAGPVRLDKKPFFNPSDPKTIEIPALATGCSVRIGVAPRVPPNDGNQPLHASGIVFSEFVPTLVGFTQANGVLAMTQRVLKDFNCPPDPGAWADIRMLRASADSILRDPMLDRDPAILDYRRMMDWLIAYPANQHPGFIRAWESLKERQLSKSDFKMGGFIKLEKGMPVQYGGVTPRGIYSMSPRVAVVLCPVVKQVASEWRKKYDWNSPYFWANGASANEVGSWHDRMVAEFGNDCRVIETDLEKCEGHRSKESFDAYDELVKSWCATKTFQKAVGGLRDVTVTYPRDDLSAVVKDKMASGRGDITICTAADSWAVVRHCRGEPVKEQTLVYGLLGLGDDGNVYGRFTQEDADQHKLKARELGFELTVRLCLPHQIVFCRNRPWPSTHGTIFGPCIGWIMARLGWHVTDPRGWSPAAVARGLIPSCNHIPFLRFFIRRMVELTPNCAAAPTPEWAIRSTIVAEPVPESYAMVYDLYGLTLSDEEDFARLMLSVQELPISLTWPHLAHCFEVDK